MLNDDVKTDPEWAVILAHLDKFRQRAEFGEWKPDVTETAEGWAFRVLCDDGGTVFECGHIRADDVERCRDVANNMGFAVMAVNSLPFLVAEVRRLRAASQSPRGQP